jgi:hypothetical protein
MTAFQERDFTLAKYERLCDALGREGYVGLGMADYLTRPAAGLPGRLVLLRHDVESDPGQAVRMGAIEKARGLVATYFFRAKRSVLRPEAIRQLAGMGHEIGYHYETLSRARGDIARAIEMFRHELARLREHASVRVASMHGSPLLPWDNRAIWSRVSPADFDLAGEVYRDIDYGAVDYFSDTGRTWHPRRFNIRDHAPAPTGQVAESTDELIALIAEGRMRRICLLTHPERWSPDALSWWLRRLRDAAENRFKVVLAKIYVLGAR